MLPLPLSRSIRCVRRIVLSAVLASAATYDLQGQQITATADGFTASTRAIEITLSKGAITRVVNRLTGEVHTAAPSAPASSSSWMPRGMLCVPTGSGGLNSVQTLHSQWGSHPIYGAQLAESIARIARAPGPASSVTCTVLRQGAIRCVYRGLTDGQRVFPNDTLTIDAVADQKSGQIEISASAQSAADDVVGVMVPVVNLGPGHAVYVPSFGGMRYSPTELASKRLFSLDRAPFVEAPVLVAEGNAGSIGLWVEDASFAPFHTFFGGDGTTSALGIEAANYMPIAGTRSTRLARWRIAAFRGGWTAALAPYRDWYTRAFATEIARRNEAPWPRDISVIVDRLNRDNVTSGRLAKSVNPANVLIHEWSPRAASFDTMLPDWTPASPFVSLVQDAHARGFKVMGYVNSHCVNFGSPVFVRDGIERFALTRRVASLSHAGDTPKTFANATRGEILYLDPLSPGWRRYHAEQMAAWRAATGADANYEDTAGTAGDFGNGTVAGLRGALGGTAQFRDLLESNPVPMATEFAADHMAFASTWVLRYVQAWGSAAERERWESALRPMTTLLFGGAARAWVPTYAVETEDQKWNLVACSDALGGVAQLNASAGMLECRSGMAFHLSERAQLFSRLGLVPDLAPWPRDAGTLCVYRDREGRLYRYRVRDGIQELVDPQGKPLYQRIKAMAKVDSTLRIPGWPAYTDTSSIALDPGAMYALSASAPEPPLIQIDKCPDDACITRYIETPDFVLVTFNSNGRRLGEQTLGVLARGTAFVEAMLRDSRGSVIHRTSALAKGARLDLRVSGPTDLLLLRRAMNPIASPSRATPSVALAPSPLLGRYVSATTGIERGGAFSPPHAVTWGLVGSGLRTQFRFTAGGGDSEITFDHLLVPPSSTSSIEFTVRNTQMKYGNGCECRVYINGRKVFTEDLGPRRDAAGALLWDTSARICRVPLGAHATKPIVLTIAIWGKGDENSDEVWLSEAKLIGDAAQSSQSTTIAIVP